MKYKNIVFDFGNVIGKFDGHYILRQFCSSEQDLELLFDAIFSGWDELDKGTVDYNENIENVVRRVPARLEDTVRTFFRGWPEHIIPIRETAEFIRELKERKVPIYLLSVLRGLVGFRLVSPAIEGLDAVNESAIYHANCGNLGDIP